jgi:hypothetical protein
MGIGRSGVALVVRGLSFLALPVAPIAVGAAAGASVIFGATAADAKSSYDSPYGYERTWNAALRLVRVDLGLKIVEKDDANGYVLFEYRSAAGDKRASSGSFELIRGSGGSGRPDDVRVVAQLPQLPRYHEQLLLDSLARKMRAEYGEPPEPRTPVVPNAPDAGPSPENDGRSE